MQRQESDTLLPHVKQTSVANRRLAVICILLTELCERLTYYSVGANLVLYCTNQLDFSSVDATTVQYLFAGTCYLVPIFGGWIADSICGRFNSIYGSGLIYIVGTILLTAASYNYAEQFETNDQGEKIDLNQTGQTAYFLLGLCFIAIGTGGIKANVSVFGAYQLEDLGTEYVQFFFNWFYWFINIGAALAYTFVAYVQQNVNFFYGYLIPALSMCLAVLIFVTAKNRYRELPPGGSVISKVCKMVHEGLKKKHEAVYSLDSFLDYAKEENGGNYPESEVEGVKTLGRVIPVFVTYIFYWTIYGQMQTSYLIQGVRMDLGFGSWIPAASLSVFNTLIILILVPILDRVFYPVLARFGIKLSHLQRIGIGMILAVLSVVVAGVVEIYRKQNCCHTQDVAGDYYEASSLSIFWQVPQFCLIGASEVFASITGLEYAYSQAPDYLQGLVMGFFLVTTGLGNYVGIALNYIVKEITDDTDSPWLPEEVNDGHLEYLFFLLAIIMMLNFFVFLLVVWCIKSPKSLSIINSDRDSKGASSYQTCIVTDSGRLSETGYDNLVFSNDTEGQNAERSPKESPHA